jgi:hypothetical protein
MRGHILLLWFILIGFTTLLIDCQFIGTCSAFWKPDADASPLTAIAALSLVVMIPAAKRLALLEEFLARHPLEGSSTR